MSAVDFCGAVSSAAGFSLKPADRPYSCCRCAGLQVLWKGYFSEREALARRLGMTADADDSQLLAGAFRKWGVDLQARVYGEFAGFVFDEKAQTALLTHDALGAGRVFYEESRNGAGKESRLAFASRLIDLLDAGNTAALDGEYFADYLARGYVVSERTPFPAIKRLLPGASLLWSPRGVRLIQSWKLASTSPVRLAKPQAYQEEFNSLLDSAVRSTTATSGNTWVALSGGLDSASVACVAARQQVRGLAALSLTYPSHPSADEQPWMRATVEHCGIPWHPIDVESVLPFTSLPGDFLAEPSPALLHGELLRTEARLLAEHGVTLLLTGDGGDAILATNPGNSPTHLADRLFSSRPHKAISVMNAWRQRSEEPRSWSYWTLRTLLRPATQHLLGWQIRPQPRIATPPWIEGGYAARMRLNTRGRSQLAPRCDLPSQQAIADTLWSVALSVGRGQPQHPGFAIRCPLLHRPLVEFMFGAPWEEKLHPRCDRYLQRRAMKGVLPELVRRRAHKAIGSYGYVEGLRRSPGWFEYLCDEPLLAELGVATAEQWRTGGHPGFARPDPWRPVLPHRSGDRGLVENVEGVEGNRLDRLGRVECSFANSGFSALKHRPF